MGTYLNPSPHFSHSVLTTGFGVFRHTPFPFPLFYTLLVAHHMCRSYRLGANDHMEEQLSSILQIPTTMLIQLGGKKRHQNRINVAQPNTDLGKSHVSLDYTPL